MELRVISGLALALLLFQVALFTFSKSDISWMVES